MANKVFCFNGKYARLDNGALVEMTPIEAESFLSANRDSTFIFFREKFEGPPSFVVQSDVRLKRVNIFDNENFRTAAKHELADCLEAVLLWIKGICPNGQSWFNVVTRDLASRIL